MGAKIEAEVVGMIPRRVLERLGKLMALASSSNVHEAEAARGAAARLRSRYSLSEDEARRVVDGVTTREVVLSGPEWGPAWKFVVVTAAAEVCGAAAVSSTRGRCRELRVSGEGDSAGRAVALVGELIEALGQVERRMVLEVAEAARDPEVAELFTGCSSRRATRSFRVGAAYALAKMVLDGREYLEHADVPSPGPEDGVIVSAGGDGVRAREVVRDRYDPEEVGRGFATSDISDVWANYGYRLTKLMVRCEGGRVVVRASEGGGDPPDKVA